MNKYTIISYCNNTYPSYGGVARYDTQLKLIFPDRIFFRGPQEKDKLLKFLESVRQPIVITDNHLACDIPIHIPTLLVHHGCAMTTAERNPTWDKYWKDLCCNGQNKMLTYRDPKNTWIVSISTACTDDFLKYYPDLYPKFKRYLILHPSELNESNFKTKFTNTKPIILGNWDHLKKGRHLIADVKKELNDFEFKALKIVPEKDESLVAFNKRKQEIYLNADIFLQLASSEGYSYASADGIMCGLVNVCTNVGQYYKDVDKDSYYEIDWKECYCKNPDTKKIANHIRSAWKNKEQLSKNARNWYLKNTKFVNWKIKMQDLVENFYKEMYKY